MTARPGPAARLGIPLVFLVLSATLAGIAWFTGIGLLAAVGAGTHGRVAVTGCTGLDRDVCHGDFVPDGSATPRRRVRVDGVSAAEGETVEARMVVSGRVQAAGSHGWATGFIGAVVVGVPWLITGAGTLAVVRRR